jgi:acetyl esterase/lipase
MTSGLLPTRGESAPQGGEAADVAGGRHGGNNTRAMRAQVLPLIGALAIALAAGGSAEQQSPAPSPMPEPQTILLWPNGAPGALGPGDADKPALTVYMPANTAGPMTAVIVAPGGSYTRLSMINEGRLPANYLNSLGIAAFVLRYRLGPQYHHPIELGDAQRALRTVRARATEWHIAPDRIGMMGFSAGGHLASTASTHADAGKADAADPIDRVSSRPDFTVLGYPVISMVEPFAHQQSKTNLLGASADPALARSLSSETQVTASTPPAFLYHTTADTVVPVENTVAYFLALRKAGVPAEMHVFRNGPHGTGLGQQDPALAEWPRLLATWLRVSGFLK